VCCCTLAETNYYLPEVMKKILILPLLFITYFSTAQVGIGTTTPDATLHIVGTTVLSGGGTTTLLNDGFEDSSLAPFTTSGDVTWQTTTNAAEINSGSFSARTRSSLDDSESSTLQYITTITTTGTVEFAVTTSTEATWDTLTFFIDGVSQQVWSGINAYTTVSYPLTTGTHTLTWTYDKDGTSDGGNDRVAIDDVLITETSAGGGGSYTFRLEDGQEQAGYVLTSDANGNGTWQASSGGGGAGTDDQTIDVFSLSGSTLSLSLEGDGVATQTVDLSGLGGGGSYSFENGINESGGTVKLGGVLTGRTTIDLSTNDLIIDGTSSGDFEIEGNAKRMMTATSSLDFVSFGDSGGTPNTALDNQTYSIAGTSYTLDVVLGYYSGNTGGSGFKMGSIEYMLDGGAELFMDGGAAISPFYDTFDFADLGTTDAIVNSTRTTTGEWEDIYVQNAVTVSDKRTKENINSLQYGLTEILKLKPVSFDYKKQIDRQRRYNVPNHLRRQKLGFVAQDLLGVIPEVVKTHDWKVTDEKSKTVEYKENNRYGVMYSDIVPVTVKAIQEQQVQIEELKSEISELKLLVKTFTQEKK